MRLFFFSLDIQRFGLQRFVLKTSHVTPKSDVEFTVPATLWSRLRRSNFLLSGRLARPLVGRPRAPPDDLGWIRAKL